MRVFSAAAAALAILLSACIHSGDSKQEAPKMIYDILRNRSDAGGPLFTPNLAVADVPITAPAANQLYSNYADFPWFEPGDNVILEGIEIQLPHGLAMGTGAIALPIFAQIEGGGQVPFSTLPESGIILSKCGKTEMNIYLEAPRVLVGGNPARWAFVFPGLIAARVSMLGVPSLIGTAPLPAYVLLYTRHTRAMAN